jgi:lysophospholipase L1-like esterase
MQAGKIKNISSPVVKKKNGSYATLLTADRTTVSVSTVPKKTLFIGNSLLQGLGSAEKGGRFGMCATDSRHDYYYYVTSAILKKNPTAVFTKLSGTAFEGSTDLDTAGRWYAAKRYLFKEDLDLIIIQLGDNVNDNEKQAAFGNNIRHLLAQIKADCPKARVICVGTWYYRPTVISYYIRACKENGCDFVSIENICSAATMPPAGTIVTYNDGTTRIAEGGSLSHPNNNGMELIAKRMVAQLKLG